MVRLSLGVVALIAAFACVAAQTVTDPAVTPDPALPIPAPVDLALVPAAAPAPALPSPPPPNANLLVTAEEINQTMSLVDSLYQSSAGVQTACNYTQIKSDYYALSTINCDRAQTGADPATPITVCPEACQTGVNFVGANCTAAINVAYVESLAAQQGTNFTLSEFDPTVLPLCGVTVENATFTTAYQTGQLQFLFSLIQKAGITVPDCDLGTLKNGTFPGAWADCKAASTTPGLCVPSCATAITAAGNPCLLGLAKALIKYAPGVYSAGLQVFEACGINPLAPAPAPVAAPVPSPPVLPPPQAPISGASTLSAAATTLASAAVALFLL